MPKLSARHQRDYSPVPWTQYFDEAHDIDIDSDQTSTQNSFRVYLRNFREPYAPAREFGRKLEPNQVELSESERNKHSRIPTLVALHGGGYSGLTWAQFTRNIEQHCHCRLLAIDLRGHGDTKTENDDKMDIDTLVNDVIEATHAAHRICGFLETPKILLIGHSMGGAIAVKCSTVCTERMPSLVGFVIIDVVEGTAKDALPLMLSVIKTRPTKFPSLNNAIEWCVRSGMAKNSDAARVSMPGNLINIASETLAIHDVDGLECKETLRKHKYHVGLESLVGQATPISSFGTLPTGLPLPPRIAALKSSSTMLKPLPNLAGREIETVISEVVNEDESDSVEVESPEASLDKDGYKKPPGLDTSGYCWRINLARTQPYWNGWFDGLSEQLLSTPVQAKFLLLAGIDRLDKTLTIGHMQGKFMMKVLPKCGHAVHEDVPEQVASAVGDFLVRNKITTAIDR